MNFQSPVTGKNTYIDRLQRIANRQSKKLEIDLDDLREFLQALPNASGLLQEIKDNTMHYVSVIAEAADSQLSTLSASGGLKADIYDNLMDARERQIAQNRAANQFGGIIDTSAPIDQQNINTLPPALLRRYDVYIHAEKRIPVSDDDDDVSTHKGPAAAAAAAGGVTGQQLGKGQKTREYSVTALRRVSAQHIGKLVRVRGMVTQVTDVKPLAAVLTYLDQDSNTEIYQEVAGRSFMPLQFSSKPDGSKWVREPQLQTRGSKFIKFQEARIQDVEEQL
eukprot:gene9817-9975_t